MEHSNELSSPIRTGKYPVTNAQYEAFIIKTGTAVSPLVGWKLTLEGQTPPTEKRMHPVVGITWDEARNRIDDGRLTPTISNFVSHDIFIKNGADETKIAKEVEIVLKLTGSLIQREPPDFTNKHLHSEIA
jgi:hypothetical protein